MYRLAQKHALSLYASSPNVYVYNYADSNSDYGPQR